MTEQYPRKIIPGFVSVSAACPNCAQVTCYLGNYEGDGIMDRQLMCGQCGETVRVSVLVRRGFDERSEISETGKATAAQSDAAEADQKAAAGVALP